MGVKVLVGDIFASDAQTLVNTVNCVGVMGKGVALEFKKRYPGMFAEYKSKCDKGQVQLGRPYIHRSLTPPQIINFPTKDHWRMPSDLQAILEGMDYLVEHIEQWGVTSLASPPLGCGLGSLDWRAVGPVLFQGFEKLPIPVILFAPFGTPKDQLSKTFLRGKKSVESQSAIDSQLRVNPALVAIVEAMRRIDETQFYHPSSIVFHKLAYFATVLEIPTGLVFERGTYGPFCPELKKATFEMIRNGLLKLEKSGNAILHSVGPAYQSATWKAQLTIWDTEIDKLVDLFLRIRSPHQAELYATVHFSASNIGSKGSLKPTEQAVLQDVTQWKKRRHTQFVEEEICDAIRLLNLLGWLDLEISQDLPLPVLT